VSWDYKLTASAIKQMRRLGPEGRKRIFAYLDNNIVGCNDPRQFGKGLTGDLGEFWRYRTSHYRMVCRIVDDELVVLVVKAGHRRDIYD
jgi:mRNA interferase RelE/StbE